jgi:hypothetical protein
MIKKPSNNYFKALEPKDYPMESFSISLLIQWLDKYNQEIGFNFAMI